MTNIVDFREKELNTNLPGTLYSNINKSKTKAKMKTSLRVNVDTVPWIRKP